MLKFKLCKDPVTEEEWIETDLKGKDLLITYLLNKGTAFTYEERLELGLLGKLPYKIETIEEQVIRAYAQFSEYSNDIQKHIYLNNLHDKNEVLFFRLVSDHISEMMPIVYTPVVGEVVKSFNHEFRQPRGLYVSYTDQDKIESIISNRTHPDVSIILVTDGERILGLGDQGVGGIAIPIAKLTLYTLCGGVNPYHTLPIQLDVGTDNPRLLNDPMYLGWRHPRIRGKEYDIFIEKFVAAVKKFLPHVFLHWEDFGRDNARRILEQYRNTLCTFNDDMQGTGVVTLAALLSAVSRKREKLSDQKIAIFGAGTAGVGIADQIVSAMIREGLSKEDALSRLWLIDKAGVLYANENSENSEQNNQPTLLPFQKPYARSKINGGSLSLEAVIQSQQISILIGCSSMEGAFSESIVKTMYSYCKKPIIFPLSNPNEFSEAIPEDLLAWTDGQALIATGSPFKTKVAQCNNALVFPGVGLGVIVSGAEALTDDMLVAACKAVVGSSPKGQGEPLLPPLHHARNVAVCVAKAVAEAAFNAGLSKLKTIEGLETKILKAMWLPYYRPFRVMKDSK